MTRKRRVRYTDPDSIFESPDLENNISQSLSEKGEAIMDKNIILSSYVDLWLELFKKNEVKPATYSRLQQSCRSLGGYEIGEKPISEIGPLDVQFYINKIADEGYSFSTIKKQLELINAALRKAVSLKLIPENPAEEISLPNKKQLKTKTKEIQAYDELQQKKIQRYITGHPSDRSILCVAFMLETGLRAGEALALSWGDISLAQHRCNVHATVVNQHQPSKSYVQDSPKTDSSIRSVPLNKRATEILRQLQSEATSKFVFGADDKRLDYPTLIRAIKKMCAEINVPYLGAHVFRHTFATNCYYKGIDVKILSKLLGHSDVKVTYNTYINLYGDGFDDMYAALCL